MKRFIESCLTSWTVPSLFVGLSAAGLAPKYPYYFEKIGHFSLFFLIIISLIIIVMRLTNYFIPRRFANSVFVIDEDQNIALILHPHYKRFQPPGSRLGYHEPPHLAVKRVLKDELGLSSANYSLVSNEFELRKYGNNIMVPKPYAVKVENGRHRLGIVEHYDYVYVCLVNSVRPSIHSDISPQWFSLTELLELSKNNIQNAPWEDVVPIFQNILADFENIKRYELVRL